MRQVDSAAFSGVTGLVANPTPTLDIGRSGDLTSVKVSLPNVCDNGEYDCGWLTGCDQKPAEWCFTLNGNHLLRVNDVYAGWFTENETRSFRTNASVQMWEDDNDVCTLDSDANVASFKRSGIAYNPLPFSSNEVGNMGNLDLWYNFEDSHQDWCGQVRFELSNTSIPFNGRLDDVRIYNQVLDAEQRRATIPGRAARFAAAAGRSAGHAQLRRGQRRARRGRLHVVSGGGPARPDGPGRVLRRLGLSGSIERPGQPHPGDVERGGLDPAGRPEKRGGHYCRDRRNQQPRGWSLLLDGDQVWFAFPGGTNKSGYWLGHGIPNGKWYPPGRRARR